MGSLIGSLTNSGVQSPGGNAQFYPSQGAAGMALAHQAAQTAQPSTADIGGGVNDPTAATQNTPQPSQPKMVRPSFMQAAMSGPGGTPDAMSPGLSKGGKLAVLLTSGLKGALAGRAAQEQTIAQTGGHRAGGIGTGFQAGVQLPFLQAQQRQQAEQGQEATQQAQAKTQLDRAGLQQVPTPYGNLPAALAPKLLTPIVQAEGRKAVAETGLEGKKYGADQSLHGRLGAADITGQYRMKALQAGTAPITQDDIDQYHLPPEFLGKMLKPSDAANLQGKQIAAAPTVSSTTDPLGQTTTKTTQKVIPGRSSTRPVQGARPGGGSGGVSTLDDTAKQLVEGDMDPSQLPKRSAAYLTILQKANAYSQQKYGKPFDVGQASSDYSYAKNNQTQNIFKLINGITEKGGSLEIAHNAAAKLPQMDSQTLNKVFNVAGTEFGSQEASNFHTAMLGLADEYSKVMGGGVSSDTGRQQGLDLLKAQYSKGQFGGAEDIIKKDLAARKQGLIGGNRYLDRQYGEKAVSPSGAGKVLVEGKDY